MEEDCIEVMRETNRNRVFLHRKKLKNDESDTRRSLTNLQLTTLDVKRLADTLKTKASISASDLKLLQNALIDDPRNVEVILYTHGALRGLVRELTGHDINKQLASCGCLCNIALAKEKTCCTLAKAAGAYLVAALHTHTPQLAVTCAWTLGNLAGSGPRACNVIIAQGAVSKLCDVTCSQDLRQPALYALTHLAYVTRDGLRSDHLQMIIQALSNLELNVETSHLLFILSCHKDFSADIVPQQYLHKIVQNLTVGMENHLNKCKNHTNTSVNLVNDSKNAINAPETRINCFDKATTSVNLMSACENAVNASQIQLNDRNTFEEQANHVNGSNSSEKSAKCCNVVYLIRVLANLNNSLVYASLLDYFVENHLAVNVRKFLEEDVPCMWWLLGNMVTCCGDNVFFRQLISL